MYDKKISHVFTAKLQPLGTSNIQIIILNRTDNTTTYINKIQTNTEIEKNDNTIINLSDRSAVLSSNDFLKKTPTMIYKFRGRDKNKKLLFLFHLNF